LGCRCEVGWWIVTGFRVKSAVEKRAVHGCAGISGRVEL
jgi:hypothetical protein